MTHHITATLVILGLMASMAHAQTTTRKEEYRTASFAADASNNGCEYISVGITRLTVGTVVTTWLAYNVDDLCASASIASGSGMIPNGDFKVRTSLTRLLTTVPGPGLTHTGREGAIDLTWTKAAFLSSDVGNARRADDGLFLKQHYDGKVHRAVVSGTIVGAAVEASPHGTTGVQYTTAVTTPQ